MSAQRILKYPLEYTETPTVVRCRFSKLLDIQEQNRKTFAWILTDESAEERDVTLVPIGTGWFLTSEMLDGMEYVKTVQDSFGYVWHYFLKS